MLFNIGIAMVQIYIFFLRKNVNIKEFEKKISEVHNQVKPDYIGSANLQLEPLSKIHLHSFDTTWDFVKKGDIKVVFGLLFLGIFVLLIGIINYVNLSTANYIERIHEAAVKKAIGSRKI